MSEINFYHLQHSRLEDALPKILEKVIAGNHKALVCAEDKERIEHLNTHLWTYHPQAFLPHGLASERNAEKHPILLSTENTNKNKANIGIFLEGKEIEDPGTFSKCLDMFDGLDEEAVIAARKRWKAYKEKGHTLCYWQQSETGKWERKA